MFFKSKETIYAIVKANVFKYTCTKKGLKSSTKNSLLPYAGPKGKKLIKSMKNN